MGEERYHVYECPECDIYDVFWDDGEPDMTMLVGACLKCKKEMTFKGYVPAVPLKDFIWHTVKKED